MDVYWRLCLFGVLLDYFSGAMGQCSGSPLSVPVPNYNMGVLSYPDDSSQNYGQGITCKWLFRSADTTLKLIFRVADLLVDCGDILMAFDGTTAADPQIGTIFCSSHTAPAVSPFFATSSSQMFLSFDTDTSTDVQRDKGFKVEILSARPLAYEGEACNSNIKTLRATTDEEVLTSPLFPDKYQSNKNCSWNITSPTESGAIRITVRFLDTDIDTTTGACYDHITTYDGQEKKQLCDAKSFKPITFLFNSSFVEIGFYSDDRYEEHGFLLVYSFLGEAATTGLSTISTTKTTLSTTEATTTTSNAKTTAMSTSETTMSTSETTTLSTAETTTRSTSETTTMSTAETTMSSSEITAMSTAETTMSTSETTTLSTAETTTMSTAETTMSSSETAAMSTSKTTTKSTSEATTGTITTETTISETRHSMTTSKPSSSSTAGTTQNQILSLTPEAMIFLVVLLIVMLVFGITACIEFCFFRDKKRKKQRKNVSSCSSTPPRWIHYFIEVDNLRNKNDRYK